MIRFRESTLVIHVSHLHSFECQAVDDMIFLRAHTGNQIAPWTMTVMR